MRPDALVALACLVMLPVYATEPVEQDFQDAIASVDRLDPQSPAAINARLEYADFLAGATDDCVQRLEHAQSLLDSVAADPVTSVVLPVGLARVQATEYRLHTSRASCNDGSTSREQELHNALESAQRARDLYRDALEYRAMAIMQFDVGVTYRLLGDDTAAVSALESAIDTDREYGFRQDAEGNSKLLKLWAPQGPANHTAGLEIPDPPSTSVSPQFAWRTSDVNVGLMVDTARVVGGVVIRSRGRNTLNRHIRKQFVRWSVSDEPGTPAYEGDPWPKDPLVQRDLAQLLTRDLLQFPSLHINHSGDLEEILHADQLASQLTAAAEGLARSQSAQGSAAVWSLVKGNSRIDFSPQAVESEAAQNYDFETGTWIGASLDQGVWYQTSSMLRMPGLSGLVAWFDVEFAYTRPVPCEAASTARSCIELLVHMTPRWDAMQSLTEGARRELNLAPGQPLQYWSAVYLRIVTDPRTLMVHLTDTRRYWHVAYATVPSDTLENVSERTVATFTYH